MTLAFHSRPALIAYVTCGDPDLAATRDIVLAAIAGGAEVVELGVPFSDPVADGPVIQRASERALRQGTTLADVLQLAAEIRRRSPQAGLIIFSYLNPVLRLGWERFCKQASQAEVDGALITDLPVEAAGEYMRLMQQYRLGAVFLAAPTTTEERLRRIAAASTGFIYAVSRTGVTGTRKELATDARELVARIRCVTDKPVAVGFGISTPEQVTEVGSFADAAVVGSALVEVIEKAGSADKAVQAVAEFVRKLSVACRRSSASKSAV